MPHLLSSYMPFASISWWAVACRALHIDFDSTEPFRKMSCRNRYYISSAQGKQRLSIPILHGREQKTPMKEVRISHQDNWQVQHWRTITAAYRRAPFFEFYESELYPLFHQPYVWLVDFNEASFVWIKERLILSEPIMHTTPAWDDTMIDTRCDKQVNVMNIADFQAYSQVFMERTGFIPDLSILDLFFAEGAHTLAWLKYNLNQEII